jgi:hypothetical protein
MIGDRTPRGFEHLGKTVFCGKANQSKKEQGEPKAEEGLEDEADEAPNSHVNPSGRAVGQLGGYGFQGAIFGMGGSCKDGTMGSGCCKFQGEEADKCARVGREEEGTSSNRPELGGIVFAFVASGPE